MVDSCLIFRQSLFDDEYVQLRGLCLWRALQPVAKNSHAIGSRRGAITGPAEIEGDPPRDRETAACADRVADATLKSSDRGAIMGSVDMIP